MKNPYCDSLGIAVPEVEAVKDHPSASAYTLLIVALLERGDAMPEACQIQPQRDQHQVRDGEQQLPQRHGVMHNEGSRTDTPRERSCDRIRGNASGIECEIARERACEGCRSLLRSRPQKPDCISAFRTGNWPRKVSKTRTGSAQSRPRTASLWGMGAFPA